MEDSRHLSSECVNKIAQQIEVMKACIRNIEKFVVDDLNKEDRDEQ